MKKRHLLCAVLFGAFLLFACARTEPEPPPEPPREEWPPFTGQIVFDDSVPKGAKMPVVGVSAVSDNGRVREFVFELAPEKDGSFTIERPGEVIDFFIHEDELPDGVGVVGETVERDFALEDQYGEFVISAVAGVEMDMDDVTWGDPNIRLLNAAGQELFVYNWGYDAVGRWLDEERGLVEISGEIHMGSAGSYPVSCTAQVPELSKKERKELLDYWGVTDGVGFDSYASNGGSCTP